MNEEKTTLQQIVEQKTEQIRVAIEQALSDGAKVEMCNSVTSFLRCCRIDGLYLQKYTIEDTIAVVLKFSSEKIAKMFEPSKDELEKKATQMRAELEEIEKQINEQWKLQLLTYKS